MSPHVGFAGLLPPAYVVWKAPEVTGKSAELVQPVTYALPARSSATALLDENPAASKPPPPRYVEYSSAEPVASSLATKASKPPAFAGWAAAAVGKFSDAVMPETTVFPAASTPMPHASSSSLPPRNVEKTIAPVGPSLVTNASKAPPPYVGCKAPSVVGKVVEDVKPTA